MPIFNLEQIKDLSDFPKVVLLYGQDAFSIDETYHKIINFLIKKDAGLANLEILDGEEKDLNYVVITASQLSMLSSKRILVVKRFDSLFKEGKRGASEKTKHALENFNKYINNPNSSTILILLVEIPEDIRESKTNFSVTKQPFDTLIKKHYCQEFKRVYANTFPVWAIKRFKMRGITINHHTAELIVDQTQPNLMDIANEIDKICLYDPTAKNISFETVNQIIGHSKNNTVYDLTNAVSNRNPQDVFAILLNILKLPRQETIVLSRLTDLFIKLLKLVELKSEGETATSMAKQIGTNTFFLTSYLTALEKYSEEEINNAIIMLANTDQQLKSSISNKKLLLQNVLEEIVN